MGGGGQGGQVNWLLFEQNVAGVQEHIRSNKVQRHTIKSVGTPFTVTGGVLYEQSASSIS